MWKWLTGEPIMRGGINKDAKSGIKLRKPGGSGGKDDLRDEINDLRESLYERNEELFNMSKEMQRIGAEREEYAEEIEKLKAELGQKEGELAKTKGKLNEIVNGLDANKVKLGWIVEFEDGVIEHLQKEANQ